MNSTKTTRSLVPDWTTAVPIVALAVLALSWGRTLPTSIIVIVTLFLAGAVLAAVHHAEVVAHRVGEPYGSLLLAVSPASGRPKPLRATRSLPR